MEETLWEATLAQNVGLPERYFVTLKAGVWAFLGWHFFGGSGGEVRYSAAPVPTYRVVTFGCQMNVHDSERIGEVLERAGYQPSADNEGADVILLNTCSVREKAEQKLRSEVGRLGVLKKSRPELVIGVAGCVAQQEGQRLIKKLPQIDLVIGPDNIPELPRLLRDAEHGAPPQVRTVFDYDAPSFLPAAATPGRTAPSTFVTTMKGCDERCTFCVVPFTRGSERYRASSEIIDEVRRLVAAGAREVVLLGQTVDSYRDPESALPKAKAAGEGVLRWGSKRLSPEDETEFPALLRAIVAEVPDLLRLRYTSPHPRHLTPALVEAHRDLSVLPRHVHMPVQSGSNAVLKRMGRRYTREEYIERTALLKEAVPGLTLSSDVIVGFPGETAEQFAETLSLVEEMQFIGLFGFKYSPRPYTAALNLEDDVTEAEKDRRLAELLALSERIRQRHLGQLVGTTQAVLVEGKSASAAYTGRTERNEIVHFGALTDPSGEIVDVRIERALKHSLVGTLTDPARALDYDSVVQQAAGSAAKEAALPQAVAARATETPAARRGLPVLG